MWELAAKRAKLGMRSRTHISGTNYKKETESKIIGDASLAHTPSQGK